MSGEVLQYCMRGIVRHLNGDIELFEKYTRKAMKINKIAEERRASIATIGEIIPSRTKKRLYKLVS